MAYELFQTLVGVWPISELRLIRYAIKAARESRRMTSWTSPDVAYEKILISYIQALLSAPAFICDLELFLALLIQQARIYSLGQALLKLTAPGVPDIYQGSDYGKNTWSIPTIAVL
jgi:(1->4)-alpha-D-glucan 1-alpha-D-glucosylmutase